MTREDFENQIKKGILANGYILTGAISFVELAGFLGKFGEVHVSYGSVGIDEIREIKEKASAALGSESSRLFFVLNADKMHRLAFPALLKAVEEPLENRHFFIMAARPGLIPETVRSRLVEVSGKEERDFENVRKFADSGFFERSKMTEEFSEDAGEFNSFMNSIENYARAKSNYELLGRLEKAREASGALNISRKMCLEYLAPFI